MLLDKGVTACVTAWMIFATPVHSVSRPRATTSRPMENLGRGVVAVRANETNVLVGWRLLGLDRDDIGFHVYRVTGSGEAERINPAVLTDETNFVDSDADLTKSNTYSVAPVVDGKEQEVTGNFTLPANNPEGPVVRVPIRSGAQIKFVWAGDLDGDGEYDFVLDRHSTTQSIEAYRSDGAFLWEVDMGANSKNQDNIEPGSAAINTGHWDGVTVYDLDSDGCAEVAVRIANGVKLGNGETFEEGESDDEQFIGILDGKTGALRASRKLTTEYISDGPLGARLGVGYLDGERPHLVGFMKNRQSKGDFNLIEAAWTFDGSDITLEWEWKRGDEDAPDGHNTRIIDVDGDGKDEVAEIGFLLNGDGTLRYSLGPVGVVHGDRYHIAKMDPSRDGLQGYGIQQDNPDLLYEYYYDATDGKILWKHFGEEVGDVGRGMAGDIDPRYDGYEVWSFEGIYNAATDKLTGDNADLAPWPQLGIWWDGDELMELYNDGRIEKWDWENPTSSGDLSRLVTISNFGAVNPNNRNPGFIGDILGDWREEVIVTSKDNDELIIFTTNIPSDIRLYTLPQ